MSGTVAVIPTTVTSAQFRTDFPEFATAADATVNTYLNLATTSLDPVRWGSFYVIGVELYAAHNIAVSSQAARTAAAGGIPGSDVGVVTSKAVRGLSKSYDVNLGAIAGAGQWNLTSYGVRFYQIMQMIGSGGLQL